MPSFSSIFEARFSEDGSTIAGAWELTDDSGEWQHDFDRVLHPAT
jgi:hypothetical protein